MGNQENSPEGKAGHIDWSEMRATTIFKKCGHFTLRSTKMHWVQYVFAGMSPSCVSNGRTKGPNPKQGWVYGMRGMCP